MLFKTDKKNLKFFGKEGEGETVQLVGRIRATGREERAYFFLEVFSQFNIDNVRQQSY